jgi:hypothetical protein
VLLQRSWTGEKIWKIPTGLAGLAKITTRIDKKIGLAKIAARIDEQIELAGLATQNKK